MTETSPCGHGVEHLRLRKNGIRHCAECSRARKRRHRQGLNVDRNAPVVYASPAALEYAERFRLRRPVENLVREKLLHGHFRHVEDGLRVPIDGGIVAVVVRRAPSPSSGRETYLVTSLRTAA